MDNFTHYLQVNKLKQSTIEIIIRYVGDFLNWLKNENQTAKTATYNDITAYIANQREQEKTTNHINRILTAIRHYYSWLQTETEITNPANGIILKGHKQRIPHDLLTEKELKEIYQSYQVTDNRTLRNKIILGLLVYQAVTTEELHKLKPENIDLANGKINLPKGNRSNARALKLETNQIINLYEYITKARGEIMKKSGKASEKLFVSMTANENIKNSLHHLFRALKKLFPQVKNAGQIRQSVITNKLKTENLRNVQHFAGHRFVSSTERYKTGNLEELARELEKHHPFSEKSER